MSRIIAHESGAKPGECRHCHMPPEKWATLSCVPRAGSETRASRPRPRQAHDDFDAIADRLAELRAEREAIEAATAPADIPVAGVMDDGCCG